MFHPKLSVLALSLALASPALAQLQNANERTPDAGNPAVPLNPPGVIAPLSGNGVAPLSTNYLGNPPTGSPPSGRTFLSTPGFLPAPRDAINRPSARDENSAPAQPAVIARLPPASTGRQGLPPQTWALMTAHQQDLHRQAETSAMSSVLGEGFMWTDSGRAGEVRVVADRMHNNRPCREFAHIVLIDGQRVTGTTTMCR
jgi:hypothetical protein